MRAAVAWFVALVPAAALLVGCEGVPDLTFAGGDDATAPVSGQDATTIGADDASGETDASVPTSDDASPPGPPLPDDAATPPPPNDGAALPDTGCPGPGAHGGVTCCGAVACKGTAQQCNCGLCAYCASEGFCCPYDHPMPGGPPGYCATTLAGCH